MSWCLRIALMLVGILTVMIVRAPISLEDECQPVEWGPWVENSVARANSILGWTHMFGWTKRTVSEEAQALLNSQSWGLDHIKKLFPIQRPSPVIVRSLDLRKVQGMQILGLRVIDVKGQKQIEVEASAHYAQLNMSLEYQGSLLGNQTTLIRAGVKNIAARARLSILWYHCTTAPWYYPSAWACTLHTLMGFLNAKRNDTMREFMLKRFGHMENPMFKLRSEEVVPFKEFPKSSTAFKVIQHLPMVLNTVIRVAINEGFKVISQLFSEVCATSDNFYLAEAAHPNWRHALKPSADASTLSASEPSTASEPSAASEHSSASTAPEEHHSVLTSRTTIAAGILATIATASVLHHYTSYGMTVPSVFHQ